MLQLKDVASIARSSKDARALLDALPVHVWFTDESNRPIFVNASWRRYTGLDLDAPMRALRVVHPDDLETVLAAAASPGETEAEFRMRRASDGAYRWHFGRWEKILDENGALQHAFGVAVDVHDWRLQRDERDRQLQIVAEAIPDIVWSIRADGVQDYANGALSRYTGLPLEDNFGLGWARVLHPDDVARVLDEWTQAIASGQNFETQYRLRRHDGVYRWFVARARPLRDECGNVLRWFGTCTDIEEPKRKAQEQRHLAEMSEVLSTSLDLDETLARIAAIGIPLLGDWSQVDLIDESGEFYTAAQAHSDPAIHHAFAELRGHRRFEPAMLVRARDVARSGHAHIVEELPVRTIEAVIGDAAERDLYRRAGLGCALVVPLIGAGTVLGTVTFVRKDPSQRCDEQTLPFAEELARRAALAINNARVYAREHRVAQTMQSASLPKALPSIDGLELHAVYVPGNNDAQIGGDWYDAFRLSDGRLVLSIGDVAGSGLDAAVTMSNMRQIIRGTAQVHADPVLMLDAADRALRLEDPHRFVTAFVGVLDPIGGELIYASAGHTPPLIRRANGTLDELFFSDLPLGLRDRSSARADATILRDGDLLVLFTDGLIESARDLSKGLATLESALRDEGLRFARDPAAYLRDAVLTEGARDDVAILTLSMGPVNTRERAIARWSFDALSAHQLHGLRCEVARDLKRHGMRAGSIASAELVLGELAGNVVRHAGGTMTVLLDFSLPDPVLHIIDEGPGFARSPMLPSDVLSESGRGLFIVSQMTREFSVERRRNRGSHARAVLAP